MTDTERRLDDIEKRLARLERAAEKPPVQMPGMRPNNHNGFMQWCQCGRDVCRAPDCPSHRNDPLGR